MLGATGYQTLNIVETPVDTIMDQCDDQDEYNVHYGTNNSPSHNLANLSKKNWPTSLNKNIKPLIPIKSLYLKETNLALRAKI